MSRYWSWLVPALLSACASIPADRGMSDVRQQLAQRGVVWPAATESERERSIEGLLAQPLRLDDAISIALLRNPRVDAVYAELGLAGAEVLQAGRLSNPRLSATFGVPLVDGAVDRFSFGIAANFFQLLWMPARTRLAHADFERAQAEAGAAIFALAADVAEAYYTAQSAEQALKLADAQAEAAAIGADYAQALAAAGNLDPLTLLQQRAEATQSAGDAQDAALQNHIAHASLQRQLGLDADHSTWSLAPEPEVPPTQGERPATDWIAIAHRSRLDLKVAQAQVVRAHEDARLARTHFVAGDGQIGADYQRDTDGIRSLGPELALNLPLFDQGAGVQLHAQAQSELAQARLRALQLDIEAEVRSAAERVTRARQRIELIRVQLLPLRKALVDATQQRVNYALLGSFDALQAKRQEYSAQLRYILAIAEYWQARVALQRAVGTELPEDARLLSDQPLPVPKRGDEPISLESRPPLAPGIADNRADRAAEMSNTTGAINPESSQ